MKRFLFFTAVFFLLAAEAVGCTRELLAPPTATFVTSGEKNSRGLQPQGSHQ